MTDGLDALSPRFMSGDQPFRGSGIEDSLRLLDYWRWSASCLMDNTARGVLAEFLVATALGGAVRRQPRVEWDAYDLSATINGREVSIEVKSSSRVQSWKQQQYSDLRFRIAPTRKWDPEKGEFSKKPCRAGIYVFCALVETAIKSHRDALNVDGWLFRVVRGSCLQDRKWTAWNSLGKYAPRPVTFQQLATKIEVVADRMDG